jgi:uncharacterized protein (TIGR02246 family)
MGQVMSTDNADEAAIRQAVQTAIDALNRGDVQGYMALYTPDADTVDGFGRILKGRANIEQAIQAMLMTERYQGAKWVWAGQTNNIRFLSPTIAVFDVTYDVTTTQGPLHKLHGVYVFVNQDGRWVSTTARAWVVTTVTG